MRSIYQHVFGKANNIIREKCHKIDMLAYDIDLVDQEILSVTLTGSWFISALFKKNKNNIELYNCCMGDLLNFQTTMYAQFQCLFRCHIFWRSASWLSFQCRSSIKTKWHYYVYYTYMKSKWHYNNVLFENIIFVSLPGNLNCLLFNLQVSYHFAWPY